MTILLLNPDENQLRLDADILSVFRKVQDTKKEIQQGMTPSAIAEIVSDHLIKIVKDDFEKHKEKK